MNQIIFSNNVFGWMGAIVSIISFITPIIPFIKCLNREINIAKIPLSVLTLAVLNSLFLLSYGFLIHQVPLFIANTIGVLVTSIWIGIYLIIYSEIKLIPSMICIIILISSIGELFYVVNRIIGETSIRIIESCVIGFSLIKYFGLFFHASNLIRSKEVSTIRYISMVCEVINCFIWLGYGAVISNYALITSYLFAFIISSVIAVRMKISINNDKNTFIDSNIVLSKGEEVITNENNLNTASTKTHSIIIVSTD